MVIFWLLTVFLKEEIIRTVLNLLTGMHTFNNLFKQDNSQNSGYKACSGLRESELEPKLLVEHSFLIENVTKQCLPFLIALAAAVKCYLGVIPCLTLPFHFL